MKRGGGMSSATNPKSCRPAIGSIGGSSKSAAAAAASTSSASSFSKENASDMSNNDTVRYQVLYYKSSRKVHKSRGVSKSDGTLTVHRSTGAVRLVSCGEHDDDDEEINDATKDAHHVVLYSGMNPAIHKRCDDLEVDETLRLGNYEIDIVAKHQPSSCAGAALCSAAAGMGRSGSVPLKHVPASQGRLVSRRPGLLPAKRPLGSTGERSISQPPPPVEPARVPNNAAMSQARVAPSIMSENHAEEDETPSSATVPTNVAMRKRTILRKPLQSLSSLSAKVPGPPGSTRPSSQPLHRPAGSIGSSQAVKRPAATSASLHKTKDQDNHDTGDSLGDDVTKRMPVKVATVLRPHQVVAVQFLWSALKAGGAILADEPGLGKTLTTIACIAALHRTHRNKHFCVVCPSSLVNNWVKEFDHWLGKQGQPRRVPLLKGDTTFNSSSMKGFLHSKVGQVVILSYDLFRLHSHHFANPSSTQQHPGGAGAGAVVTGQDRFALLVVDEGHRLKSTTGSLTLTSLELLPADARLLLSATPIQNNLGELYTLANFCRPGILGDSITEFRRRFEKPIASSHGHHAAQRELEQILSTFMLRRLQTDVLKSMLPPRMEALIFCRPSQRQCDLYRQIVDTATSSSTSVDVLSALTSLRKVCSHPFLHEGTTEGEQFGSVGSSNVELSGKFVVLQGLLRSMRPRSLEGSSSTPPTVDKVVIVSNFTSTLSLVESLLLKPSGYSYLRLDGSTSPETRQSLVDAFNKQPKIFCFLLSSKAGGCGLNLIGANRLVLLDPSWNPADDIQAMGRIYRQGQQRPTSIYRLFTSGTIEEVMYQRQSSKNTISGGVLDNKAGQTFSRDEINDCMSLKAGCDCDTRRKAIGKCWPPYVGLNSLLDQGVDDTPLTEAAKTLGDVVGLVRIVPDGTAGESMAVEAAGNVCGSTKLASNVYKSDSEEEFEFEAKPSAFALKSFSAQDEEDSDTSAQENFSD